MRMDRGIGLIEWVGKARSEVAETVASRWKGKCIW